MKLHYYGLLLLATATLHNNIFGMQPKLKMAKKAAQIVAPAAALIMLQALPYVMVAKGLVTKPNAIPKR